MRYTTRYSQVVGEKKFSIKLVKPLALPEGINATMVAGIDTIELAKMIGITPVIFSLMGRFVD